MAVEEKDIKTKTVSRRRFLENMGKTAVGLAVGTATLGLVGCSTKTEETPNKTDEQQTATPEPEPQEPPEWPWEYTKLDPEATAKRGYEAYFEGACCYGVFAAVVGELQDKVGFPFTQIPLEIMKFGEGGVVGKGSLCGTVNGAAAAINLVGDEDTYRSLIKSLLGWYNQEELPNFVPDGEEPIEKSVAGSTLCHASVTNWCKVADVGATSPERAERCARLVAEVAGKTVTLLNDHADGKAPPEYALPESITGCMSCHGADAMNNTRGSMDCLLCHDEHD